MSLQHSGGLPVGYVKEEVFQSGYKVLGLTLRDILVVGFLGFWVFGFSSGIF